MSFARAPFLAVAATMTQAPGVSATIPNFLIYQPDSMLFTWPEAPILPDRVEEDTAVPTPNIDRLRTEGVVFTRAYCSSPMCAPSRFSTLTGRYASRSGYARFQTIACDSSNGVGPTDNSSSTLVDVVECNSKMEGTFDKENNLATVLKAMGLGYYTGTFGKWHLSADNLVIDPPNYLDEIRKVENYANATATAVSKGFDVAGAFYITNMPGAPPVDSSAYGYSHNLEFMVAEVTAFFEFCVEAGRPFFAYVNPTVPNTPDISDALYEFTSLQTPSGVLEEAPDAGIMQSRDYYKTACDDLGLELKFCLGVLWVDDAFGALLDNLEALNVLDDTLVVFMIDHGSGTAHQTLFEPAVRTAMFARYQPTEGSANAKFLEGVEVDELVSNIDLLPTFVDIAAEAAETTPPALTVDGQSFKALATTGQGDEERTLFLERKKHRAAVTKSYKLIRLSTEDCAFEDNGCGTLGTCSYDLGTTEDEYYLARGDDAQFYDLQDGAEVTNIIDKAEGKHITSLAAMRTKMIAHIASTKLDATVPCPTCPTVTTTVATTTTALWIQHA